MGYPPVVMVSSGGVPRTQVAEGVSAPAFTVVESGARPITLADNSPSIALFNEDGTPYAGVPAVFSFAGSMPEGATFARASVALDLDPDGEIIEYAVDAPRVHSDGILLEPAATNLLTYSRDTSNAAWTLNSVTQAEVGEWREIRETTANAFHRLFRTLGTSGITNGAPHVHSAVVRKVGRRYLVLRASRDGGATSQQVCYDLDTATVLYSGSGLTGFIVQRGDAFTIGATFAGTATAQYTFGILTATAAVLNDTIPSFVGDTAQGFDYGCSNLVTGSTATSIIETLSTSATRAADDLDLPLPPPGTRDMYHTFDDDSTQVVSDVPAGTYAVPTNLDRARLKNSDWGGL